MVPCSACASCRCCFLTGHAAILWSLVSQAVTAACRWSCYAAKQLSVKRHCLCGCAVFIRLCLCVLSSLFCPLVALGACCSAACVRSQDLQLQAVHAAMWLCLCEVGYMLGVHLQHGGACSSSCRTTARSCRHGGVRGGAACKECAHIMESVPGCVGDDP